MISILMPVKNAARFIEECVNSITEQTRKEWELIAVNDHSSDQSADILENLAQEERRIRVLTNEGSGILDALRTAQKNIQGDFVTRMDADDLMPPDKLCLMRDTLVEQSSKTLVTGKVEYFADGAVSEGYLKYQRWLNQVVENQSFYKEIYRECGVASPNWMIRTTDFTAFGGFKRIKYPEDYDMLFHLLINGIQIIGINEVTHYWREHPERTSRNDETYQQPSFFKLKLDYFLRSELDEGKNLVLWGVNRKSKLVARTLLDRNIPFNWFDWRAEKYQAGIYNQRIKPIEVFHKSEHTVVINCVWPSEAQKQALLTFVRQQNLDLGTTYFEF